MLAPFAKKPLSINLRGVTNNNLDLCVRALLISARVCLCVFVCDELIPATPSHLQVDTLKQVTLPLIKRFGVEEASIDVRRRVRWSLPSPCLPVLQGSLWWFCSH